ncbi:hypothetical protein EKE94_05765 [Mesobaculum littorinae]|uniref:SPOR domain-containing protein n=1 Tax=Mesobaculum littorinae TaxID=2486419 RepID=A0A438AIL0_9RHOB|nr:SPOR domain-containing protein [Mesobaculum littorinae]RVV98427.1 hypothetical protein EKE94_05765 [Mesobaculum littorinae]
MTRHGRFALALIAATIGLGAPVLAQDGPAETPPDRFEGREYVDSAGCVFVRAGYDGAVTWVPRLTADREPLCGRDPTEVTSGTGAPAAPAPLPQVATDTAPSVAPPPQGARAATRDTAQASTTDAPRDGAEDATDVADAAADTARDDGAPVVAAEPAADPASSPFRRADTLRDAKSPQIADRGTRATRTRAATVRQRTAHAAAPVPRSIRKTYPAPVHKVRNVTVSPKAAATAAMLPDVVQAPQPRPVTTPKGYEPAWEDGRLNPHRGKQTFSGAVQTALVWTQTVPRRLVDKRTGRDVTRDYNYLVFPYTDYHKQQRDLEGGLHVVVRTQSGDRMIVEKSRLRTRSGTSLQGGAAVVPSSKSSVTPRTPAGPAPRHTAQSAAGGAGRYVQVGSFANAANAEATAQRLSGAGYPVRMARSGGLRVVMAGPFTEAAALQQALTAARRSGFRDAFVR